MNKRTSEVEAILAPLYVES